MAISPKKSLLAAERGRTPQRSWAMLARENCKRWRRWRRLNRHARDGPFPFFAAIVVAAGLALAATPSVAAPATCHAASGPQTMPLVELFTSEGCDSCPPADRWLSAQFPPQPQSATARAGALALAFHVDYWDRLGWRDRFASAQFTQRQYDEMEANGSAFVYTPQVLVQGHAVPDWKSGKAAEAIAAALRRHAARVRFARRDAGKRRAESCRRRDRRRSFAAQARCAVARLCRQRPRDGCRRRREPRRAPSP